MSIYGLDQVGSRSAQTTSAASNSQTMGKDDFLSLLVAQLKAQDPLNPMDSTGFTAQLAQFSSLEQLQNINSSLGTIGGSQSVLTNSQAVEFIGKNIKAIGNTVQVTGGESQSVQYSLEGDAAGLYVKIYDQQGNFIRQIESGPQNEGQRELAWDGRDYLGGRAPDGVYTYEVAAIDTQGNSVTATTFAAGEVTGVNFKDGLAYLQCGAQEIRMGDVIQVQPEE